MIVVAERGELRLVTQPDHARFAAELLALWHRDELRRHPRRESLLLAVREHDNGWREADAAPRVDPASGRPYDFRGLPSAPRRELWRRGIERFAADRPYVALLAATHAQALHRGRARTPGWQEFLAEIAERRDELAEETGLDPAELAADYAWLELADALSLAACCRSPRAVVRPGLRGRWRRDEEPGGLDGRLDGELELDPFPLAGATTFRIPCRWIPDRHYSGEAELASALGGAVWQRFELRCRPPRRRS